MVTDDDRAARNKAFIAGAPTITEAVLRAARFVGVVIRTRDQADAIADAASRFATDTMGRRVIVHRESWLHEDCRSSTRDRMRRELYIDLADKCALPVAQPSETIKYVIPEYRGGEMHREVTVHDDWLMVVVDLMVPVRYE